MAKHLPLAQRVAGMVKIDQLDQQACAEQFLGKRLVPLAVFAEVFVFWIKLGQVGSAHASRPDTKRAPPQSRRLAFCHQIGYVRSPYAPYTADADPRTH